MIAQLEELKSLLWEHWDPIGVNNHTVGGPRDEYDAYAFEIFTKVKSGAKEAEIRVFLEWAATEYMGLSETSGHTEIARRVMEIFEETRE